MSGAPVDPASADGVDFDEEKEVPHVGSGGRKPLRRNSKATAGSGGGNSVIVGTSSSKKSTGIMNALLAEPFED